ncbi:hypothetical protein [Breoghania sp. L-A4]|uniref:hypothetical protein n=1 Tax=Breoghania sp. L-A4 TaxID=2304600 RepID=UPI000E35ACEA|nr:hypothetical protein [Breoghania sp. L-A4]AXS40915.1 hypothetical protein D1F64_13830 [Breoghania sp. L-A4]
MTWNSVGFDANGSAMRPATPIPGNHKRRPALRSLAFGASMIAMTFAVPAGAEQQNTAPDTVASTAAVVETPTNPTMRTDRLAVTVAKVANQNGIVGEPGDDMDIWVGEVEVKGRKTVWVELIDRYGEVIYDAEVAKNETHLLPDGRAIVVRAVDTDAPVVAKADSERVQSDARLVITRRVVDEGERATSVEFLEVNPREKPDAMVAVGNVGTRIWNAVANLFSTAASNVRYAFGWIVSALTA